MAKTTPHATKKSSSRGKKIELTKPRVLNRLLFQFACSTAAFDTGILITNASAEPFSKPTAGVCVIRFFGGGPGIQAQTSTAVAPGSVLAFSLQNGGTNGVSGIGFFNGYIIVDCYFPSAYGLATLTDPAGKKGFGMYQAIPLPIED